VYSLSEGNVPTTDFEHSVLVVQYQQYTLQRTAFLLATLHSDRTNFASPSQASKHALCLELPKVHTRLLSTHPLSTITVNH